MKSSFTTRGRTWRYQEGGKFKKLDSAIKLKYDKGLPERKIKPGPYPIVGSSGIVGYHSEYLVKGPTIIIGSKR